MDPIDVARAELRFRMEEGEIIWTESSYKFRPEGIRQLVEREGFVQRNQWIDDPARFALTLFQAV
jgi:L-histidine Nalpha-methyltransferase